LVKIIVLTLLVFGQSAENSSLVKVSHTKDKLSLDQLITDTKINTLGNNRYNEIVPKNHIPAAMSNQIITKTDVKGFIDYRKYDTMKMNTLFSFSATISKNILREMIKVVISFFFNNHPVQKETIRISKVMTTRLVSDYLGFTINLLNGHPEQIVVMEDSTYTEWD
jgi:hypothetical protein